MYFISVETLAKKGKRRKRKGVELMERARHANKVKGKENDREGGKGIGRSVGGGYESRVGRKKGRKEER